MDTKPLLSAIESELQRQISRLDAPRTKAFHEMLTYHMGWTGEGAGPEATGKRIRPLLVLLTCLASSRAAGEVETWQAALPAAALAAFLTRTLRVSLRPWMKSTTRAT